MNNFRNAARNSNVNTTSLTSSTIIIMINHDNRARDPDEMPISAIEGHEDDRPVWTAQEDPSLRRATHWADEPEDFDGDDEEDDDDDDDEYSDGEGWEDLEWVCRPTFGEYAWRLAANDDEDEEERGDSDDNEEESWYSDYVEDEGDWWNEDEMEEEWYDCSYSNSSDCANGEMVEYGCDEFRHAGDGKAEFYFNMK